MFMWEYEILNNAPGEGNMFKCKLLLLMVFLNKILNKILTSVCFFVLFFVGRTWLCSKYYDC